VHLRIRWLPFNIVPKKLRIVAVDEEGKPGSIRWLVCRGALSPVPSHIPPAPAGFITAI